MYRNAFILVIIVETCSFPFKTNKTNFIFVAKTRRIIIFISFSKDNCKFQVFCVLN